ncbi:MAG: hypothetical protein PHN75_17045 [Syntrophales bacterium]|nr:hypothetical protein [Syntrophales bacterium]
MDKKRWVLSDGRDVTQIKMMTSGEAEEANIEAEIATDGNWFWYQSDTAQITD